MWCCKFGPTVARNLRRRHGQLGDVWRVDEVFITIRGKRRYLWRAVDQDGDVPDILVTRRRDARAAKSYFRKLLTGQGRSPLQLLTDRLRRCAAARRELGLSATHRTGQYDVTSSQRRRCSVFSRFMRPFTTHSGSHAIVSRRSIIDSFGSRPSPLGTPRRVFAERRSTHRCSDQNRFAEFNSTMPSARFRAAPRPFRPRQAGSLAPAVDERSGRRRHESLRERGHHLLDEKLQRPLLLLHPEA